MNDLPFRLLPPMFRLLSVLAGLAAFGLAIGIRWTTVPLDGQNPPWLTALAMSGLLLAVWPSVLDLFLVVRE